MIDLRDLKQETSSFVVILVYEQLKFRTQLMNKSCLTAGPGLQIRVAFFLKHNVCCGYSKEPSLKAHVFLTFNNNNHDK